MLFQREFVQSVHLASVMFVQKEIVKRDRALEDGLWCQKVGVLVS